MADAIDKKISELDEITNLTGDELFVVAHEGENKKVSVGNVRKGLATEEWVENKLSEVASIISDAPKDGLPYVRMNGKWVELSTYLQSESHGASAIQYINAPTDFNAKKINLLVENKHQSIVLGDNSLSNNFYEALPLIIDMKRDDLVFKSFVGELTIEWSYEDFNNVAYLEYGDLYLKYPDMIAIALQPMKERRSFKLGNISELIKDIENNNISLTIKK